MKISDAKGKILLEAAEEAENNSKSFNSFSELLDDINGDEIHIKKILQLGNSVLREICKQVQDSQSSQTQEIITELIETLGSIGGVGLAAPQIGYTDRIILIRPKPTKSRPHLTDQGPIIMINPSMQVIDQEILIDREGCLSIPKAVTESQIYGKVPRYKTIQVHYTNQHGNQQSGQYEDFVARIIQHEIDHLDGILFIDSVDMSTLCSYEEYLKQL